MVLFERNVRAFGPGASGSLGCVRSMSSLRKRHAVQLFSGLPGHYDRVGAVMSFGQDPRWRRALVDLIDPRPGMRILDVATGTGMVAFALAARGAEVVGLDQSEAMLAAARVRLARTPALAGQMTFIVGEAEALPFADGEFDALSFTYLLRYVDDRAATLGELARVVSPGGRIGMVEFGVPGSPASRWLWRAYTRVGLPLLGRAVSRAWYDVGRFLGPNIEQLHEAEADLPGLWRDAGIAQTTRRDMSFGAGVVMAGVRDGARSR
jgi:demethylmenaquinone methyltransferase/2-methoxy-6-polyprenyl-1,4-benzoquinol methylase